MSRTAAAPLISIVLPVSGVEDYLAECLDSVLGQSAATIEVIAVDDASPDRSGEILAARAATDPRLRVIRLPEAGGPGSARNRGLAMATGEYVWFVDPDDLLAPGSVGAVAGALLRERPDLLLLDYQIRYPSGRTEPSPGAGLLRPAGPPAGKPAPQPGPPAGAGLTLAACPALINRSMTLWSKVFRRAFLTGLAVPFPPGIHEDVRASSAALLRARRIALLDRVCYLYRRRGESFLGTPSMANFSIFTAYEQVFGLLASEASAQDRSGKEPSPPPVTDAVRAAVFGRAIEHYSTIMASGLVPRQARRDYFRRMAADYRRYRPAGFRPPGGLRGLKVRLIALGNYPAYATLGLLNEARVRARRALRRLPGQGLPPAAASPAPAGQPEAAGTGAGLASAADTGAASDTKA